MGKITRSCSYQERDQVMRSCWALAVATMACVLPASAQQVDQNLRQHIERLSTAYVEFYNNRDAAGLAALFTKDGVFVSPANPRAPAIKSAAVLEQYYQAALKLGLHHDGSSVDSVSPLGSDAAIVTGEYHYSSQGPNGPIKFDGTYTAVSMRDGATWKFRLLTAFPSTPPPPATK